MALGVWRIFPFDVCVGVCVQEKGQLPTEGIYTRVRSVLIQFSSCQVWRETYQRIKGQHSGLFHPVLSESTGTIITN